MDERAQQLIGVPFRLHGRDPATGLDCIGLVACAVGGAVVPTGYRLRQGAPDVIIEGLNAALVRVAAARVGDVLLLQGGVAQFHLAVMTTQGFVHACALLRRVLETPGLPTWPVIGAWRKQED